MALDFSGLKIFVVDDIAFMRTVLRDLLVALGVERGNIAAFSNGEKALEEIGAQCPNLLVTDYRMEPMDGLELMRRVRHHRDKLISHTPIILCTGCTESQYVKAARDAGVNEVLAKPVNARALYERLRSIVEEPRPFEKSEDYFGPDRRRRDLYVKDRKRATDRR